MVIGSDRLKEVRIIISGYGSRCRELSSNLLVEIGKKKTEKEKKGLIRGRILALKAMMSTRNYIMQ